MKLSGPQLDALRDARAAQLTIHVHGWANNGLLGHSTRTVESLAKRGLLDVTRVSRSIGTATITTAGRKVIA